MAKKQLMSIALKRVYEPPDISDGKRILVDRLWPRALDKTGAKIDLWLRDVAPSTELRKWFNHDPKKWEDFKKRYRNELRQNPAFDQLKFTAKNENITLVYAARDKQHNNAVALKEILSSEID